MKYYFTICCLLLLFNTSFGQLKQDSLTNKKKPFIILVDAGHGGKDPGMLSSNTKKFGHEKHIALSIALKLGTYLQNRLEGVKVIYTRKTNVFVSLEERAQIANKENVNLVLSIHCNSHPDKSIRGTQVHIQDRKFTNSYRLSKKINKELKERALRPNRGIQTLNDRKHNLYVLQYTKMPAILIETGFLSNSKEEKYLNSEHGQSILASAIFRAVRSYIK